MPLTLQKPERRSSSGLETLREEIAAHHPILLRIEIRARAGRGGRPKKVPVLTFVPDDPPESVTRIFTEVVEALAEIEDASGEPLKFSAQLTILPPGGAEETLRSVIFQLDDEDEPDESGRGDAVASQGTVIKRYERVVTQLLSHLEHAGATIQKLQVAAGANTTANLEVRRFEWEREKSVADIVAQDAASEREMNTLKFLGEKWLVTQAAKEARAAATAGPGDAAPTWRRLIRTAGVLVERPEVLAALGEQGGDLLKTLAVATQPQEVSNIVEAFKALNAAGKIDAYAVITAAPELLPFADILISPSM